MEVVLGVARFWPSASIGLKPSRLGLCSAGPNEYENNVNNNWYTNRLAAWCLQYAGEALDWMKAHAPDHCRAERPVVLR